ncbi:MAG: glycosyltransferase family 39 protein, partial [Candidatus Omnitrophica bacterium]|nr:glycosyltransferase family 39 protein [Candidatus Omnitrophota bacterium]
KYFASPKDMGSEKNWHINWDKVRIAQCFLDAFICLLVYFAVRIIYQGPAWPALVSAFLYSLSFYNIYYTKALLSESLAAFLLSLSVLLYLLWLKQDYRWGLGLSGACFGLTILTRPEYILLPLAMAAYIFLRNRNTFSEAAKNALIFILSVIIIIAPWTLRNYLVFKKPVMIATGELGYSLFLGTFEGSQAWHGWGDIPEGMSQGSRGKVVSLYDKWDYFMRTGGIKIMDIDRSFMKLAQARIRERPFACLQSWLHNIRRLWYQNYIPMYLYKEPSGGFFIFYFLSALYAFFKSPGQEKALMAPVGIIFAYLSVVFLPLHIEPRYGVALMPAIICLSGLGLWKILKTIAGAMPFNAN